MQSAVAVVAVPVLEDAPPEAAAAVPPPAAEKEADGGGGNGGAQQQHVSRPKSCASFTCFPDCDVPAMHFLRNPRPLHDSSLCRFPGHGQSQRSSSFVHKIQDRNITKNSTTVVVSHLQKVQVPDLPST